MSHERLQQLKPLVGRFWITSPERLWRASIALHRRGHWILAFWLKQLNTLLNHNSLAPGATVGRELFLGHNSIGIVITGGIEIGDRVKIWQNVTLSAGRPARRGAQPHDADGGAERGPAASAPRSRIVIEDGVTIGANAVVIAPRGATLRLGRGARVGAGTVVTRDVPARATIVGAPASLLVHESPPADTRAAQQESAG